MPIVGVRDKQLLLLPASHYRGEGQDRHQVSDVDAERKVALLQVACGHKQVQSRTTLVGGEHL